MRVVAKFGGTSLGSGDRINRAADSIADAVEQGHEIAVVASGMDSITFYVDTGAAEEAEAILHESVIDDETLSSVTLEGDFAVVRVTGGDFPNQSGIVQDVIAPLAERGVAIHDVITSATSVAVFVPWADRERTLETIQDAF